MNGEQLIERFGDPIKVLDHGHIRLVDVMGDDSAICQAARVSYGAGTKTVTEDRGLIRYLMRMRHSSPFEQCEIKLHWKLPIFVARQVVRHRTVSLNEVSGRYSELPNEMYKPEKWRAQSGNNKQGSSGAVELEAAMLLDSEQHDMHKRLRGVYIGRIDLGAARELARIDLPLSQYTEWYWKVDLHNLLHFLSLRLDSHAQYETRVYAEAIADIVKQWVPYTWEAFVDYRLKAYTVSRMELELLNKLLFDADIESVGRGFVSKAKGMGMSGRELSSFINTFFLDGRIG